MNKATLTGSIRSIAECAANPLQTTIEFILTDFKPNKNGEALDISESGNILASIISMPLKANFANGSINGHAHALPVGTITFAELIQDPDPYIVARATVWKDEYKELDTFLRTKKERGDDIGTSWELYYKHAEERDGIKWLKGVVMAASTVVKNPSYGNRTPILAIAETITMDETNVEKLNKLESTLWAIWEMIQELRENAVMADAVDGIDTMPTVLREVIDNIKSKLGNMATAEQNAESLTADLESARAELTTVKEKLAALESEKAEAELDQTFAARSTQLALFGITRTRDFILGLSSEVFAEYLKDLEAVSAATQKTTAEVNVKVPNIVPSTQSITIDSIANAINARG